MPTRIDDNARLWAFLNSGATAALTALAAACSLFIPRLPPGRIPGSGDIAFFCRSGSSNGTVPLLAPSYQFKCYGSDPIDARNTYRLLYDALLGNLNDPQTQTVAMQAAGILNIEEETIGQDMIDTDGPGDGWPYVLVIFRVHMRT